MAYYSESGLQVTADERIAELEEALEDAESSSNSFESRLDATRAAFKRSSLLSGLGAPIAGAALAKFLPQYPKVVGLDTDLAVGAGIFAVLALRKDRDVARNYQANALLEGVASGSLAVWAYRSSQK